MPVPVQTPFVNTQSHLSPSRELVETQSKGEKSVFKGNEGHILLLQGSCWITKIILSLSFNLLGKSEENGRLTATRQALN